MKTKDRVSQGEEADEGVWREPENPESVVQGWREAQVRAESAIQVEIQTLPLRSSGTWNLVSWRLHFLVCKMGIITAMLKIVMRIKWDNSCKAFSSVPGPRQVIGRCQHRASWLEERHFWREKNTKEVGHLLRQWQWGDREGGN